MKERRIWIVNVISNVVYFVYIDGHCVATLVFTIYCTHPLARRQQMLEHKYDNNVADTWGDVWLPTMHDCGRARKTSPTTSVGDQTNTAPQHKRASDRGPRTGWRWRTRLILFSTFSGSLHHLFTALFYPIQSNQNSIGHIVTLWRVQSVKPLFVLRRDS